MSIESGEQPVQVELGLPTGFVTTRNQVTSSESSNLLERKSQWIHPMNFISLGPYLSPAKKLAKSKIQMLPRKSNASETAPVEAAAETVEAVEGDATNLVAVKTHRTRVETTALAITATPVPSAVETINVPIWSTQ